MKSKTFQLNIPISKVDEEQRIVTGIATTESLDSQGDIVDYEASKAAFSEWLGNIREMHGPIAIGKGIDTQFDDANRQVIISAKISESADGENAWIKVKEGILAGFSIGGRMLEVVKDKSVKGANRITKYVLSEVSLVDNPANPDAMLMMVKSADGGLQRVEDMKKSVFDAARAISVATELAFLIMDESWEEEADQEQMNDLRTAFDAVRAFAAKEVSEDDTYLGEQAEVFALAEKAINLRKEALMATKEDEKVEKSTAVHAGEERDDNAEVVTTAEENGRPENDTQERAEAAGVAPKGTEEVVTVPTEGEVVEEDKKEAPAEDKKTDDKADTKEAPADKKDEKGKEKADSIADLAKNVETLLTKLGDNKDGVELKKAMGDFQKSIDKVEKSMTALEGRIRALEDQPLPTKAKATFSVITKGDDSEVENTELAAALARQEELIANPHDAQPGEHEAIARTIRNATNKES